MALLPNPLTILPPLLLLTLSIPLALFATLTTTLAIGALLLRVSVVYLELGLALLHSSITHFVPSPHLSAEDPLRNHSYASVLSSSRSSTTSLTQNPSSPLQTAKRKHRPTKSDSLIALSPGPDRDFEGVGGWRTIQTNNPTAPDDDALWIGMNARLELPAHATHETQLRHHRRSLTGGMPSGATRVEWSPTRNRISPSTSRARTRLPTPAADVGVGAEGYFTITPVATTVRGGGTGGRNESVENLPIGDVGKRRRTSGSTGSSTSIRSAFKVTQTGS